MVYLLIMTHNGEQHLWTFANTMAMAMAMVMAVMTVVAQQPGPVCISLYGCMFIHVACRYCIYCMHIYSYTTCMVNTPYKQIYAYVLAIYLSDIKLCCLLFTIHTIYVTLHPLTLPLLLCSFSQYKPRSFPAALQGIARDSVLIPVGFDECEISSQ